MNIKNSKVNWHKNPFSEGKILRGSSVHRIDPLNHRSSILYQLRIACAHKSAKGIQMLDYQLFGLFLSAVLSTYIDVKTVKLFYHFG
ncbi:MAG: hypothetical protein HC817_03135 [Saprospiraceae bacterium]|nr:hypothetical protein [Saprospiraceae bacterium]